jgi:hypothetical protein
MAILNKTVDVVVTESSSGFTWELSLDGGISQSGPLTIATIKNGDALSVTVNILAGTQGDQCVFQSTPLMFFRPDAPDTPFTPEWYEPTISNGNSTLTFTDIDSDEDKQNYHFHINAIYTSGNETPQIIQSPDPTIVNDGIDHPGDDSSQERTQPAVAVV